MEQLPLDNWPELSEVVKGKRKQLDPEEVVDLKREGIVSSLVSENLPSHSY